MFIGEAPGKKEDLQGKPFVGHAGKVLDRALLNSGIKRSEVFLTSVVKCRPPNNRVPRPGEIHSCLNAHLRRQIRLIDPEIICLLGTTATRALLGLSLLKAVRGRLIVKGRRYFATYHPAAAGRSRSWNNLFEADIRKLGAFLTNSQAGKCT
jgi:DNA polymerase